jgi:hypothetical protein
MCAKMSESGRYLDQVALCVILNTRTDFHLRDIEVIRVISRDPRAVSVKGLRVVFFPERFPLYPYLISCDVTNGPLRRFRPHLLMMNDSPIANPSARQFEELCIP